MVADAGIPCVEGGFFFDFHVQRHETSTLLAASGVHPKTAQSHMRHGDISLTMTAYGHTLRGQEEAVVEAMPSLSLPSSEQQRAAATGTDDKPVDAGEGPSEKLTPQWTPELTPAAYGACNQLAADVNSVTAKHQEAENQKSLQAGRLNFESDAM